MLNGVTKTQSNLTALQEEKMAYLGSKAASGAYQKIIALMPPHETYIEPFLGGGAVMLNKPAAVRDIGLDLCAEAINNFSAPEGVEAINTDAFQYLRDFDYQGAGNVLIYADPPYLPETRTSKAKYNCELTRAQHVELLQLLDSLPANVILSGYQSQLYDDYLKGWNKKTYRVMSRGGVRTEVLWYNFEADAAHWASFAGKDRADRQRIKRLAARWGKNYARLSDGERLAVMAEILKSHEHDSQI